MRTFGYTIALLGALALSACSVTELAAVQSDISTGVAAACKDVAAAAVLAPTSPVVSYANAACPLGQAAATLVKDSATIQWLGQVQQQLSAAAPAKS